jgi:hypothetical protein
MVATDVRRWTVILRSPHALPPPDLGGYGKVAAAARRWERETRIIDEEMGAGDSS